jgi:hypothetical protein
LLDGFDLRGSLSDVSGRAQRLVERRKISTTLKMRLQQVARRRTPRCQLQDPVTRIKELELE